jgi:cell wall-associated NlpC family hydrolase
MIPTPRSGSRTAQLARTARVVASLSLALALLASCSGAPRYQGRPGEPAPDRKEIVRFAKTFMGTPYRSGGTNYKGVDCSGFVFAVYREFDIKLPRTSLDQSHAGQPVDPSELKPADLVFFKTSKRSSVTHVGIYVGGGNFVHASTSQRKVRVDALDDAYYRRRFTGARRVIDLWRPELASERAPRK